MANAHNWVASSLLAIATVHALPAAYARDETGQVVLFDLPAQPLTTTLLAIGQRSGQQIIFPGDAMAGLSAPAIHGRLRVAEALARALAGTGFRVEQGEDAIFIRAARTNDDQGANILVTGSRIKGGAIASPVYTYSTTKARNEGVTDMRGLAAIIPQNFTGGQSPGIGYGAEGAGSNNIDSSTALNLRGLGPGTSRPRQSRSDRGPAPRASGAIAARAIGSATAGKGSAARSGAWPPDSGQGWNSR